MKDELYGAYDSRSAVSKSTDPEKTLSDSDRIKALEKQVKELRELISGFKATSPLWGDIKKGVGLNEKALQISKKINSLFIGYPWIKSIFDTVNSVYAAIFGAGTSSFAAGGAQPIKQMEIKVTDPASGSSSTFRIIVGDSTASNDALLFSAGGNFLNILWRSDLYIQLISSTGAQCKLSPDTLQLISASGTTLNITPVGPGGSALNLNAITVTTSVEGAQTFYAFQ